MVPLRLCGMPGKSCRAKTIPERSTTTLGCNIDRSERNIEPIESNALTPALKKRFCATWGRTDLRISLSEAKFNAEADFDVRLAVAPPKPHEMDEKLFFGSENVADFSFSAPKCSTFCSASFFWPPSVVQN